MRQRLRATLDVVANVRQTFGLVLAVDRGLLVLLLACQLLDALGGVAIAYVGKKLVDAVVLALRSPPPRVTGPALLFVSLEFALVAARALIGQLNDHAQLLLRAKLGLHVNLRILDKAARASYARFEDPEFINKLTQARREASARPLDLVNQALALLRHSVSLAGYGVLLWALGPWAAAALAAAAVPPFIAEARRGRALFTMRKKRTERLRKSFYLESVLTTEQTVKEVKLLSLSGWLTGLYRDIEQAFYEEERTLHRRHGLWSFGLGLLAAAALYGAYGIIVLRAVSGAITLGTMTLYLTVFRQGQVALQSALGAVARMYEGNLYLSNLYEYLAVPDDEFDEPLTEDEAGTPPRVEFRDVSYSYPGAEQPALAGMNLVIEPGQTVALVGRNGAGKTTLVKLLVGLYRPTSGTILIDGVDTATMSVAAMRRKVGVIFQDFARFQFSAADNVGVGWLPAREDRAAIERAVDAAGARAVAARLPRGLDTPLGRAFGGDDLSGGQWQRLALARAFMRKSPVLVLDEPTAAMDAEAEHEIFLRFRDLRAGRTALLITHRFSTVRMADRIVVLEGGRVVEQGSHAELIASGGRYATMFALQAQGYTLDRSVG